MVSFYALIFYVVVAFISGWIFGQVFGIVSGMTKDADSYYAGFEAGKVEGRKLAWREKVEEEDDADAE